MTLTQLVIFILGIICIILIYYVTVKGAELDAQDEIKQEKFEDLKREVQQQEQQNFNQYGNKQDNISDDEFKTKMLEKMDSNNVNLVELQQILKKQNKMIDDIKFNTGCMSVIMATTFIAATIILIAKASIILQALEGLGEIVRELQGVTW